ncbi:MAG: AAA family ATPase [Magnetococcales bacterium]|nr:AAA family ATPase [Magnetococcales bacterium]
MLIEFSVANFGPFADEVTLSMVAANAYKEHRDRLIPSSAVGGDLVPLALVYGPNASGKSTLLKAMAFMKSAVLDSFKTPVSKSIGYRPFLLNRQGDQTSSGFEVILIAEDGNRYQYGFEADAARIWREWLYYWPGGYFRTIFTREWSPENDIYTWSPKRLGTNIPEYKSAWMDDVLPNRLFLSVVAQKLPETPMKTVYNWFNDRLVIRGNNEIPPVETFHLLEQPEGKKWILDWMRRADLTVSDVEIRRKMLAVYDVGTSLQEEGFDVGNFIHVEEGEGKKQSIESIKPILFRGGEEQDRIPLPYRHESDGTQKWFEMAGFWKKILEQGQIVLVDELETHLHHQLSEFLIDLFHNRKQNVKNAQLISTTHDVALMNEDLLRRDQVWICDKDASQSARLYPLSFFKPRKGEALLNGYLAGRYGGIPRVRRLGPIGEPW